jgi:hypothetical protein
MKKSNTQTYSLSLPWGLPHLQIHHQIFASPIAFSLHDHHVFRWQILDEMATWADKHHEFSRKISIQIITL